MNAGPFEPQQIHPDHRDHYAWEVLYADGGALPEVEGDRLNHYADIDQSRVVGARLRPLRPGLPVVEVAVSPGSRLVLKRRRTLALALGPRMEVVGQSPGMTRTIIGSERGEGATAIRALLFVGDDGSILGSDTDTGA